MDVIANVGAAMLGLLIVVYVDRALRRRARMQRIRARVEQRANGWTFQR